MRSTVMKVLGGMAVCVVTAGVVGPVGLAGASGDQPAFYTYQAPGGAGTAGQKVIALTFDDGPSPYTPQVLSVLQRYGVPATFFEIGDEVVRYPQYSQLLTAAGYSVENHTWNHPDLATLSAAEVGSQIDQTQQEIHAVTGRTPNCLRPPYDAWNATVLSQIASRGLTTMSYSVDPSDYKLPGAGVIASRVIGAAFPGAVVGMHDGGGDRSETVAALPQIITTLRAQGYRFVSVCGSGVASGPQASAVYPFGSAPAVSTSATSNTPFVGASMTPTGKGYWLASSDGGVFTFGDAAFHGSAGAIRLNQPIVGMAATPDGGGYWLSSSDGGVFTFGDAAFHGSAGAIRLNQPIVGMAATPDGGGYWLVASDGGIFTFGDAAFHGSAGAIRLNQPIVGMAATPDGGGYWLVASDGGIFTYGDAAFHGSAGAIRLNQPIVGMAAAPAGTGYWLLAADGGVFTYGVPYYGSGASQSANDQFFAVAASPDGNGYLVAGEHPPS